MARYSTPEREEDEARERALRSVDPRRFDPRQRSRMAMLADDAPTTAERGAQQLDHFIDPDD